MNRKSPKAPKKKKSEAVKPKVVKSVAGTERPQEAPDHNYTWILLNRMREALLAHRIEKRIVWEEYRNDICAKIGIDPEAGGLNYQDPRNWIWNGHDPGVNKLNRYARYLKVEYPDFDFSSGYEKDYLRLALSLSSFSLSRKEISDLEKVLFTKRLTGKVLVSRAGEEIHDGRRDRDFDVIHLRGIGDTPFLSFAMFKSTVEIGWGSSYVGAKFTNNECKYESKASDEKPFLKQVSAVRFGILCPTRTQGEFQGMMRDEIYNSTHVLARFDPKIVTDKEASFQDVWLNTREISFIEEGLLRANFTVWSFNDEGLREILEKIGEPAL